MKMKEYFCISFYCYSLFNLFLFNLIRHNLIWSDLTYLTLSCFFLILFHASNMGLFLSSSFLPYSWDGSEYWWSHVLGLHNGKTFLFQLPHGQHFFIQDPLWCITSHSSFMYLCCLSQGGILVDMAIFFILQVLHSAIKKGFFSLNKNQWEKKYKNSRKKF